MENKPYLELSGQWKLTWADGQRGDVEYEGLMATNERKWIDAIVPGEVHLDLWKAGIIENPYIQANCLATRWVEECIWSYRRTFIVTANMLKEQAWLYFEGLDYAAIIYVNGFEAGKHANFYLPCSIDVSSLLCEGENTIIVQLDGGLFHASEKPVQDYYSNTFDIALHKRIWLRKPQSSFGWDWSTRFINIGIYKPVRVEWGSWVKPLQTVVMSRIDDALSNGKVIAKIGIETLTKHAVTAQLQLNILGTTSVIMEKIRIEPETKELYIEIDLQSPQLW